MKRRLLILSVLLCLIFTGLMPVLAQEAVAPETVGAYLTGIPQGFGTVKVADFVTELVENPPFLLDVRQPEEVAEGVIPGAVSIPLRELAKNLDKLPADLDTPIVVYCKSGHRGAIAMTVLGTLGYTNVRNLSGAFVGWKDAGNAVDAAPVEAVSGEGPAVDAALVAQIDAYLNEVLPQSWGIVSASDLGIELVENPPFLLDVREQAEWDGGYIEGAVHVPVREVAANLSQLPEDTSAPIVVYCKSGHRGAIAMAALGMMGYTNVRNLGGGYDSWVNAGNPVVGAPEDAPEAAALDMVTVLDNYLNKVLPQGWGSIKAEDLNLALAENPPFLLDVREPAEVEEGRIAGAVHVPLREIGKNLNLLPADLNAPIVVYCKSGHRGAIAMVALGALGYTNVLNLAGGIGGWTGAGFEVSTEMVEPVAGAGAAIDAALAAAVDAYLSAIPQGFGAVAVDAVSTELLENPPFLLDVREATEWETDGYIEGAVNVPLRTLAQNLSQLPEDKNTPILVYCKAGHRGAIGMTTLGMLGYTNVRNINGGIMAWINAGFPVVGGAAPAEEAPAEVVLPQGAVMSVTQLQPVLVDFLANVPQGFASIPASQLQADQGKVFVLDVRELDEYEGGHIEGAVNIPLRDLAKNLHLLPAQDQPIVVYCSVGHRGGLATMALNLLGYEKAVSLRSGLKGWAAAGGALVEESTPAVAAGAFPEVDANLWTTVDAYLSSLPQGFGAIKADDLNVALAENPPFLLDVREPAEFEGGRIAGAVNAPLRQLGDFLDSLPEDMDAPIVVYDSIGHRGAFAAEALQMLGYANARSLSGGLDAWAAAGFPLEK